MARALDRLEIEHIPAYSPEARGRSERMFGSLQDRLPKKLKPGGIDAANGGSRCSCRKAKREPTEADK